MIHVDLVFDPACPWCYIGVRRFWRAQNRTDSQNLSVAYRAYQLNPEIPASGMPRADFLRHKFGSARLAYHLFEAVKRAGVIEGIEFRFDKINVTPNTLNALRLVKWSDTLGGDTANIVETLFYRYFCCGDDIGRKDVLVDIARETGMDWRRAADLLSSDVDVDRIMAEINLSRQNGVRGVPFFIFDRQYSISGVEDLGVFDQTISVAGRAQKHAKSLETT